MRGAYSGRSEMEVVDYSFLDFTSYTSILILHPPNEKKYPSSSSPTPPCRTNLCYACTAATIFLSVEVFLGSQKQKGGCRKWKSSIFGWHILITSSPTPPMLENLHYAYAVSIVFLSVEVFLGSKSKTEGAGRERAIFCWLVLTLVALLK